MNAELLLTYFNRISDAPDAVPRLRRFILDLAVRGKLVEQDPKAESASQLLKLILSEKTRLVKAGQIRGKPAQPAIEPVEVPFILPAGWVWIRLGDVIHLVSGQHLQPNEYSDRGENRLPYITGPADFGASGLAISRYALVRKAVAKRGQILLTVKGAGVGKTAICDIPEVAISRQLMAMSAIGWTQHFLLLVTHRLAETLRESARSLIPGISREDVDEFVFPLPPLAEQHRIVAKVNELMALCDQLEAAQRERESRRDRLAAATHHHLNNEADVDALRVHAQIFIGHLPSLTARPDQIKQLRQTILNLAVRGKLVSQRLSDEPASKLLKRIQEEKARLSKAGEIEKQRPLPAIQDSALPFRPPNGWTWTRLGDLTQLVTSGSRDWAKYYSTKGAIFLRMGNLSRDSYRLRLASIQRVQPPAGGEGSRTKLEEGDVLISITGEVGLLGLIPPNFGEAYINQHTCLVRPMRELVGCFLPQLFCSPFGQQQFDEPQRGLKNSFRLTDVTHFLVPLPPLAEQYRIVAKVDELMALCDQLEARLATAQTEASRLLESVLHNALNLPVERLESALST